MTERVATGGLMSFHYDKKHLPKLNEEQKRGINDAYERYYKRKARERKKKISLIILIVAAVLILLAAVAIFLRNP